VIRVLVFAVQFLFWLLVVRLVLRTLARLFSASLGATRTGAPRPPQVKPAEDLILDRVCQTHVPRSRALTASVAGREEHFCSTACRDRALAAVVHAS